MMGSLNNFHDFLKMGGYAAYIWAAYGIVVLMLGCQFYRAYHKWRRFRQELSKYVKTS